MQRLNTENVNGFQPIEPAFAAGGGLPEVDRTETRAFDELLKQAGRATIHPDTAALRGTDTDPPPNPDDKRHAHPPSARDDKRPADTRPASVDKRPAETPEHGKVEPEADTKPQAHDAAGDGDNPIEVDENTPGGPSDDSTDDATRTGDGEESVTQASTASDVSNVNPAIENIDVANASESSEDGNSTPQENENQQAVTENEQPKQTFLQGEAAPDEPIPQEQPPNRGGPGEITAADQTTEESAAAAGSQADGSDGAMLKPADSNENGQQKQPGDGDENGRTETSDLAAWQHNPASGKPQISGSDTSRHEKRRIGQSHPVSELESTQAEGAVEKDTPAAAMIQDAKVDVPAIVSSPDDVTTKGQGDAGDGVPKLAPDGATPGDVATSTRGSLNANSRATGAAGSQGEPVADQVDQARFVQRVTRAFEAVGNRAGSVRMRLHPPELGSLRLEITIRNGAVQARLETETSSARNLLLDNLPALRDRLAQQNIKVERFDVDLTDRPLGGSPQGPDDHPQSQARWENVEPRAAPQPDTEAESPRESITITRPGHEGQLNIVI